MADQIARIDPDWAWSPFEPDDETPWTRMLAAHLFRRAAFSAGADELDRAAKQTPAEVVDRLLAPGKGSADFAAEMNVFGSAIRAGGEPRSLTSWWLYRMLHTPDPLLEKTTLFWHGHFATSAEKVTDARVVLAQNELLRSHALKKFGPLVQAISRDPAMLVYLDSATNRKVRPNENYARELMELFCLGTGHYGEDDIQQLARCFTGWEVRGSRFRFNRYEHDEGEKTFLGHSGRFDGDEAVEVVIDQPAAPRFIAAKLVNYFVFDEPQPPAALIEPLAAELRTNDFNIGAAIRRILTSRLFYSSHAVGRKVRSPVDLAIGLLRSLEATTNMVRLAEDLSQLGHAPFFPPNVKGWEGGRTWINSSTMLGRANLVRRVLRDEDSRFAGGKLEDLFNRHGLSSSEATVDWLLELLAAVPVPAEVRDQLVEMAAARGERNETLANVIHVLSTLPEFQLC